MWQCPTAIKYLDRPPAGWFVLDIARAQSRRSWVALMIDVPPDELKHCRCGVAMLYIDPREYRPGTRTAHEGWLRIPGRHRTKRAAWNALQDMIATRH
jgi:hypothetical protein